MRSMVGRSPRERRNLRRISAYPLCLLPICAEFRRNGTLRMGSRRCFAPGPLRNCGSLRRVSNAFWAPPFVSARFSNYGAEKFHWLAAPNVRKAVPKCVPPRLRSQSGMLRAGDYPQLGNSKLEFGIGFAVPFSRQDGGCPYYAWAKHGGARPLAEPQWNRR